MQKCVFFSVYGIILLILLDNPLVRPVYLLFLKNSVRVEIVCKIYGKLPLRRDYSYKLSHGGFYTQFAANCVSGVFIRTIHHTIASTRNFF